MPSKSVSSFSEKAPLETDLAVKAGENSPSVRYFQIHFEFLHEQLQLTQDTLQVLQMQLQQLQQQSLVKPDQVDLCDLEGLPVPPNHQPAANASKVQPEQRSSTHV